MGCRRLRLAMGPDTARLNAQWFSPNTPFAFDTVSIAVDDGESLNIPLHVLRRMLDDIDPSAEELN